MGKLLAGESPKRSVPQTQHLCLREGETGEGRRMKARISLWVSNRLAKEVGSRASCLALGAG